MSSSQNDGLPYGAFHRRETTGYTTGHVIVAKRRAPYGAFHRRETMGYPTGHFIAAKRQKR
ncbi:MAG: hypothetical protein GX617_04890 [Lentisphaerae bacterium]|nr:hypothetical protein [Lentisphaerota bacterium]